MFNHNHELMHYLGNHKVVTIITSQLRSWVAWLSNEKIIDLIISFTESVSPVRSQVKPTITVNPGENNSECKLVAWDKMN